MEMQISFSSRTLVPAYSAKTISKLFSDQDITVLDWPANKPDLIPICNLWDILRERWETVNPTIDPFTVYVTGKFEVRSAHVGVRTFISSHCVNQRISRQDKT